MRQGLCGSDDARWESVVKEAESVAICGHLIEGAATTFDIEPEVIKSCAVRNPALDMVASREVKR